MINRTKSAEPWFFNGFSSMLLLLLGSNLDEQGSPWCSSSPLDELLLVCCAMRFRRLRFISATGRSLIVPAANNRLSARSHSDPVFSDATATSIVDAAARAIQILEDSHNSLREPMMHLAASAEALAAMATAISDRTTEAIQPAPLEAQEALKTAIDLLTAKIEQLAERPVEAQPPSQIPAVEDLKTSIDRLTAKIERLAEHPADPQPQMAASDELKTAIDRLTTKIEQVAERSVEVQPPSQIPAVEELKTSIDRLTVKIEQLAERATDSQPTQMPASDELKIAIDGLTAKIEQLGGNAFRPTVGLSAQLHELHELLKEFD